MSTALATLSPREALVIKMWFGHQDYLPRTPSELFPEDSRTIDLVTMASPCGARIH